MNLQNLLGFLGGMALINACGSVKGDDFIKEQVKRIDITGASSLAVTKLSDSNNKQLVKFASSTSDAETVNFLDKDGKQLDVTLQFVEVYNINEDYLTTCVGQHSYAEVCYLVSKIDGSVWILAEDSNDMPFSIDPEVPNTYIKDQKIFKADLNDKIYYLTQSSTLVQIDVSAEPVKQLVSYNNEYINEFAVSNSGVVAYFGYNGNLSVSKIIAEEVKVPDISINGAWTNEDGELYVSSYRADNQTGMEIYLVKDNGELENYVTTNNMFEPAGSYILNIRKVGNIKATILVSNKTISELFVEGSTNLIVVENFVGTSVNAMDFASGMLFVATTGGTKLVMFDFEDEDYFLMSINDTAFLNYNIKNIMAVNDTDITFTAEKLSQAGTMVRAHWNGTTVEELEITNSTIETLIKIN